MDTEEGALRLQRALRCVKTHKEADNRFLVSLKRPASGDV